MLIPVHFNIHFYKRKSKNKESFKVNQTYNIKYKKLKGDTKNT